MRPRRAITAGKLELTDCLTRSKKAEELWDEATEDDNEYPGEKNLEGRLSPGSAGVPERGDFTRFG